MAKTMHTLYLSLNLCVDHFIILRFSKLIAALLFWFYKKWILLLSIILSQLD